MKYLFIGGPVDGQRIDLVLDMPFHKIITKPKPWEELNRSSDEMHFREDVYERQVVADEDGRHTMYVHTSMRGKGLCAHLIRGYAWQPTKHDPEKIEFVLEMRGEKRFRSMIPVWKDSRSGNILSRSQNPTVIDWRRKLVREIITDLAIMLMKTIEEDYATDDTERPDKHGTQR